MNPADIDKYLQEVLTDIGALQSGATQLVIDVQALRDKLNNPPAPNIIPVPWVGQNVPSVTTDDYSNSDCGPACVAMLLRWRGNMATVDDVSRATGLSAGYLYTTPLNLIVASVKLGLTLSRSLNLSRSFIQAQIISGSPLIVLVHYPTLKQRYDQNYKSGHFIVVVGFTDTEVIYNDPYWPDETGKQIHLDWATFAQAMTDCALDGNTANQGLVIA